MSIGDRKIVWKEESTIREKIQVEIYGIHVAGRPDFCDATREALELLVGLDEFADIRNAVTVIREGNRSRMILDEEQPVFEVGHKTSLSADPTWYASCIAHDAYHSILFSQEVERLSHVENGGYPDIDTYSGKDAEKKCMGYQLEILQKIPGGERYYEHVINNMVNPTHQDLPEELVDW